MGILRNLFYWIYLSPFRLYLKSDRRFTYHGPILGTDLAPHLLDKLATYRMDFYRDQLPYLLPLTEAAKEMEKEKDLFSYHIWAEDETGAVVGSCMYKPFPFEITSQLDPAINEKHSNFLEISRLLVRKQRMGIGMKLLYRSGFLVPMNKFRGVLGICRPVRFSMFSLVGMSQIGDLQIPERNNARYHVISATFGRLTFAMNLLAIKSLISQLVVSPIPLRRGQLMNWMLMLILVAVLGAPL